MRRSFPPYSPDQPSLQDVEAHAGVVLLEFGTDWCGHCQAAQPAIADALAQHHDVLRIKVEDGKGRVLGRHYGVKLWPTLIFLNNGVEVTRLVRPTRQEQVMQALTLAKQAGGHGVENGGV